MDDAAHGSEVLMFSVVVGTFNGAQTLRAALDALDTQDTRFSYEVIVVNDASTDATPEIATRPGVRLINLDLNQGHGHTLNVGLQEARGRFMALMDDDCVPPPEWIQQLGHAWNSVGSDVTMIGGVVEPLETNTFNRRYVAYRRPLRHQEAAIDEDAGIWARLLYQLTPPKIGSDQRAVFFPVGANMSVRVDAAREAGGFIEERGSGEEETLARKLRAKYGPETAQLFPGILMYHDFDASLHDTMRRSRSYGRTGGKEWVRNLGSIPSFNPLPACAVLLSGAMAILSPLAALVVLVLSPFVLYRRWFTTLKKSGARESLLYPFIHAGEDLANNAGFVQGIVRELRRRRDVSGP